MDREKLMKMAGAVRTGGKGTMRRQVLCMSAVGRPKGMYWAQT